MTRLAMLASSALALALAASAAGAQTAVPVAVRDAGDRVPVVLTVSGGISLGSYQSGVNWALVQFFKQATFNEAYRDAYRREHPREDPLPRFRVTAIAGASAGNINGVLSALEWCRQPANEAPEQSAFWRTWITTGWEQIFPVDPRRVWYRSVPQVISATGRGLVKTVAQAGGEPTSNVNVDAALNVSIADLTEPDDASDNGVFIRDYYRGKHFKDLDRELDSVPHRSCRVPVGITVTRLRPEPFQDDDASGLRPVIQRSAAVVVVQVDSARGNQVVFLQPSPEVRAERSLGAVIALGSARRDTVDRLAVYRLIEASSAFPLAFGPRTLRYYPARMLQGDGSCPRTADGACRPPDSASFVDGGVFDNNPLDLAVTLDEKERRGRKPPASVIYIDPDSRRDSSGAKEIVPTRPTSEGGMGAVVQLFRGAIPSARQYELFAFARAQSKIDSAERADILITDRYHPVVGTHLNAFAAFFGRPFREHDFYVGVYDAANLIARRYLCTPRSATDSISQGPPDRSTRACVQRHVQEIIDGQHVALGPVAPSVMQALYDMEFRGVAAGALAPPVVPPGTSTDDSLRVLVLRALVTAMEPTRRESDEARACSRTHIVETTLCSGGFDRVLERFATPMVRSTVRAWSRAEACGAAHRLTAPDACHADGTLVELLENPPIFTHRRFKDVLRRVWQVERDSRAAFGAGPRSSVQSGYERMAEVMEFWYRSSDERFRGGFDADPSTIPSYTSGWLSVLTAMPFQMSAALWSRAYVATWRPTVYLGRQRLGLRTAVILPVELARTRYHDPAGEHLRQHQLNVGAGIGLQIPKFFINGVQVSAFGSERLGSIPRFDHDALGGELSLLLAGGKVKFGVRRLPQTVWGTQWYERTPLVLGISDLNGLAYWYLRQRR